MIIFGRGAVPDLLTLSTVVAIFAMLTMSTEAI